MAAQYRTINRGGASIYETVRKAGFEPMDFIRFYHLRAYDRINAPQREFLRCSEMKLTTFLFLAASYLERIQQDSGISFHEAQVALARQWLGDQATTGDGGPVKVTIKSPEMTKVSLSI